MFQVLVQLLRKDVAGCHDDRRSGTPLTRIARSPRCRFPAGPSCPPWPPGPAAAALPVFATSAEAASPPGDVVGKITVGYQGWFACPGDGAPINGWWHWSRDWFQPPSPGNTTIVSWPDMRDYTHGYPTAYANLGNGQPATPVLLLRPADRRHALPLDAAERLRHRRAAALQPDRRRGPDPRRDDREGPHAPPRRTGRKFYIMYDVTDWTNMQSEIKTDWTTKMSAYTASPAYARQNGKPVVCIWGFGFNDDGRPFAPAAVPGRHQLVQGPGLLRDRRRADASGGRATTTPGPASSTSTTPST